MDLIPKLRKALWLALEHDVLNTAKAAAYSGMLMLFPTMVVITTLLALVPEGTQSRRRDPRHLRSLSAAPIRWLC